MRHLKAMTRLAMLTGFAALWSGCVHVKTDPIKIEPVRIDIYHHVDQQLNDFFEFENAPPAPAPGTPGSLAPRRTAPTPQP